MQFERAVVYDIVVSYWYCNGQWWDASAKISRALAVGTATAVRSILAMTYS